MALGTLTIRPARLSDAAAMRDLINGYAGDGLMLRRSEAELCETIRDFLVAEGDVPGLMGCAAVHFFTAGVAELKSLAVADAARGHGVGRALVEGCCRQAREWGVQRLFCLTYQEEFFARLGFVRVERARLPEKVWGECVRCAKFLNCDEIAMWRHLDEGRES